MYSFLKAFLVLMKLLSLSQFYAPKLFLLMNYEPGADPHQRKRIGTTKISSVLGNKNNSHETANYSIKACDWKPEHHSHTGKEPKQIEAAMCYCLDGVVAIFANPQIAGYVN